MQKPRALTRIQTHPVSADASASWGPGATNVKCLNGAIMPRTPAFAGVYGEGSKRPLEHVRTKRIYITRRIEPGGNIIGRKVARHAFKIRHPGAAIAIDSDKSLPPGLGAPSIHAPQLKEQDRPEIDRHLLVMSQKIAMNDHGGHYSLARTQSDWGASIPRSISSGKG